MYTIGNKTALFLVKEEKASIRQSFLVGTTKYKQNSLVSIDPANGNIEETATANKGRILLGRVVEGNADSSRDAITVETPFNSIIKGVSSAAITRGQLVLANGQDADGREQFSLVSAEPAGSYYAVGMALETVGSGATLEVGLFRTPVQVTQ